jgi:hypothetical protein
MNYAILYIFLILVPHSWGLKTKLRRCLLMIKMEHIFVSDLFRRGPATEPYIAGN